MERRKAKLSMSALCCALLVLAVMPATHADDEEEDAEAAESEECVERPLGWLARSRLVSHLGESYPWITQVIVEESLVACAEEDTVEVSFEPHLSGPRWDRSWTLACERLGMFAWSCEFPEEETFVYLSEEDVGVRITRDVAAGEALEALAAIVLQSAGPGIPDPFDASEPFRDLTVDSVLSVAREEFCSGLSVPIQLDPEAVKHQFCVEREACGAQSGSCPWSVRVEGATE
jgi:hypothetical protein